MSRTVTALYDSRAEAEAARERLSSTVSAERVKIVDKDAGGSGGLGSLHLSNDDRHAYGEGLRRGGALLCAEVDGHEDADRIIAVLEQSASVDLDQRQESWRSEGWAPGSNAASASTASASTASGSATTGSGASGSAATGRIVEEQRIPIVEEELRVGKREVERGGARVRSYVRETPVQEQVTLREEHVEIERRPVQGQASTTLGASGTTGTTGATGTGTTTGGAEDLLQERTIEMRETAEEAVVQKVANVREEVVVTKTAEERTETVQDTVRRTEVDIEGGEGRSAFGGFGSGNGDGTSSTSSADTTTSGDRSR
ncbi:MAG TPA: YsnF/AvaK domain-containing protein [Allosphingosinicella sp.]